MREKHFVEEHYQKHTFTEIQHIPGHDSREDTLEFRNAKKELENVEHIGCHICGSMKKRQSHHIHERCDANGFDFKLVAYNLYNHWDFHGHCRRDFKSWEELLDYFMTHFNGHIEKVTLADGTVKEFHVCDVEALDTIYNQFILCYEHHQVEGKSAHKSSWALFCAMMAAKPGFTLAYSPKEYEGLQKHEG